MKESAQKASESESVERSFHFEKKFIVEFADVDRMGVMHNGKYSRLMEDTFTAWLRSEGLSLSGLERIGFCLPVRSSHFRYRKPLRLEEPVAVRMTVTLKQSSPLIRVQHEVVRLADERAVTLGRVTYVLCKYQSPQKLIPVAAKWLMNIRPL